MEEHEILAQAAESAVGGDTITVVSKAVEPELTDMRGAQGILCLSHMSVRKAMHSGELRAVRYGGKVLFPIDELRRFAASLPAWEPR